MEIVARSGHIPEKMDYVVRPQTQYKVRVDGQEYMFDVKSSFAYPFGNEKSEKTAFEWGADYGRIKIKDLTLIQGTPNQWVTSLMWIDIQSRSEGSTVYKVVDPEGRLFDLRDDVFMECLMAGEVEKREDADCNTDTPQGSGIYLTGKFLWGVAGSQCRLIRHGSESHKALIEAGKRRKLVKIPRKDLEIGGIYENKIGTRKVIIAHVKGKGTLMMKMEDANHRRVLDEKGISIEQEAKNKLESWVKGPNRSGIYFYKSSSLVTRIGTVKIPSEIPGMQKQAEVDAIARYEIWKKRQEKTDSQDWKKVRKWSL